MDVHPYFSKYGHRVARKYRNRNLNKCKFVASEADLRALIRSYHSLTFAYFKPFMGLKYTAGPDWSKKFVKPMNTNFASKLRKLAIFLYGGFEAVGHKWLHETDEEEEECTKPRKQPPTRHQQFKKGHVGISENKTHGALFLEKVFCGLRSSTTLADVNKIKSSECSASV